LLTPTKSYFRIDKRNFRTQIIALAAEIQRSLI